jgi:outer membrane lipopolysaccharide assembly protein LptE/RlpB
MLRKVSPLLLPLTILFGCLSGCLSGCGYHQLGSAAHLPASVHTLAVPYFENRTQFYHTEQMLTQAVVRELNTRTKYAVVSGDEEPADATLKGVVLTETIVPYTYNSRTGQSSSYMITVIANVTLTDRDGRVLYQHQGYNFHQQYEATADLASFIQEDSPAMERLGRDFAHSLVSDMLESF